ncbi:MAG: lipid II flippase MurJ, partial [Alphaproteobacteria bacterium]|nr:lipid II flippase MurJ [Alphaproteobacteria bacterium]
RLTPGVKRLLILMAPIALGAGAYQISLLTDVIIASFLPEGSLSYLFYADRLNQLPLGVVGIAVGTALLPLLSRQLSTGQDAEAMVNMNRAIEIALFFALPAAVALMLVPELLIGPLFQRGAFTATDTLATAGALGAYAIGLPAYILVKVLSPAFFARQDTKTPIKASVVALVINLVLNLILMGPLLHVGLALATAVAAWVNVGILAVTLLRRGQLKMDARLKKRVPRALLASLLMGLALYGLSQVLQPWFSDGETSRIAALAALVGGGVLAYGLAAHVFGALRAQELLPMVKGRSRAVAGPSGDEEA